MNDRARTWDRAVLALVITAGLATTACGGDDGGGGDCTGRKLTADQLCLLSCRQTTTAQAQAALGPPQVATSGALQYSYSCNDGQTASAIFWDFVFTGDVLTRADVTSIGEFAGASLPPCLASCQ
jgi:hypothetical protein